MYSYPFSLDLPDGMIQSEFIFYKNDFQTLHIVMIFYWSNIFIVFLQDWGALKK